MNSALFFFLFAGGKSPTQAKIWASTPYGENRVEGSSQDYEEMHHA